MLTLLLLSAWLPGAAAAAVSSPTTHTLSAQAHITHARSAYQQGLLAESIAAYERALALAPNNPTVRAELAHAYAQLGDSAAAAREYATAATADTLSPEDKARLSTYSSILTQSIKGGPRTYRANLQVGLGASSNINGATTNSYMVLPALAALGPARLSGGATAQGSLFTELSANLAVRQPLSPAWALFAGANAQHSHTFASSAYHQTTLNAEAGLQHLTPTGRRLSLGASARQFWYGGDSYSHTAALTTSWVQPLTLSHALGSYASVAHTSYPSLSSQNATRLTLGTQLESQLTRTLALQSGVYGGEDSAKASLHSHTFLGALLGTEYFPTPHLALTAEARYELRDYNGTNPLYLSPRFDRQVDLSLGLAYALTPHLSLRPSLGYRHTYSNQGLTNSTRWQSLIALRYTWS